MTTPDLSGLQQVVHDRVRHGDTLIWPHHFHASGVNLEGRLIMDGVVAGFIDGCPRVYRSIPTPSNIHILNPDHEPDNTEPREHN